MSKKFQFKVKNVKKLNYSSGIQPFRSLHWPNADRPGYQKFSPPNCWKKATTSYSSGLRGW